MRTLFIVLFILFANLLVGQMFTYEYIYQPDSTDVYSKKNDILNLKIQDNNSIFYSLNSLKRSEFAKNATVSLSNGVISFRDVPKAGVRWSIFKSQNSDNLTVYNNFHVYKYQYEDTVKLNWILVNETKLYGNLKVKKATTNFRGREYTAWFAEDIPISSGPYKFYGLPGLIVELYDTKQTHHFKLIDKVETDLPDDYFSEFEKVTKEEYNQFYKTYKNNPIKLLDSEGMLNFSDETKSRIKNRVKKNNQRNNNPIELL